MKLEKLNIIVNRNSVCVKYGIGFHLLFLMIFLPNNSTLIEDVFTLMEKGIHILQKASHHIVKKKNIQ